MATTCSILTFIILCVTAFVSFRNNQRMELEITKKNTTLISLDVHEKDLASKKRDLAKLLEEIPIIKEETRLALVEEAKLQEINRKLKADVEAKNAKIAANDREVEDTKAKLQLVGDPTELVGMSKNLKVQSLELDEIIKNKESKLANLNDFL